MFNSVSYSDNPFKIDYGQRVVRNYNSMKTSLVRGKNRNNNPFLAPLNWVGEGMLSGAYGLVKSTFDPYDKYEFAHSRKNKQPSAVIASNGIKMSKSNKKLKMKNIHKETKKAVRKVERNVAKKLGFGRRKMGRAYSGRGRQRVMRFRGNHDKIISQPLVRAVISKSGAMVAKSKRANCMTVKTRVYLGEVYLNSNGTTGFVINGNQVFGQYFFNPANSFYMTTSGNLVGLARMFQTYKINNVSFTFKPLIAAGNPSQYTMNYCFIDDPNLGETFIASYTTTASVTVANVLAVPDSGDFPAWATTYTIRPKGKSHKKSFQVRSDDYNEIMPTGTVGIVALNRECYAFGMWLAVDGPAPGTGSTPISKVFMNINLDLCDMAPLMLYDATGGTTFSEAMKTRSSFKSDIKMHSASSMMSSDVKQSDIDYKKYLDRIPHEEKIVYHDSLNSTVKYLETFKNLENRIKKLEIDQPIWADIDDPELDSPPKIIPKKSDSIKSKGSVHSQSNLGLP